MNRFRSWTLPVGLVAAVTGFMLSTQFRTQAQLQPPTPSHRITQMARVLQESEKKRTALEEEISTLKTQLTEIQGDAPPANETIEGQMTSGLLPVTGSGIRLTLDDKPATPPKNEGVQAVIRSEDLLKVINELWAADAEAIAVNRQRIMAQTDIADAGSALLINRQRVASPYTVEAIGPAANLQKALSLKGGVLEYLQFFGIQAKISRLKVVQIPAYTGRVEFHFSQPMENNP